MIRFYLARSLISFQICQTFNYLKIHYTTHVRATLIKCISNSITCKAIVYKSTNIQLKHDQNIKMYNHSQFIVHNLKVFQENSTVDHMQPSSRNISFSYVILNGLKQYFNTH